MALSREPQNRRALYVVNGEHFVRERERLYLVMKRLPIAPFVKSKVLDGRARLTISRLMRFRKLRISSFFGEEMSFQSSCRDSTISSHSSRALPESDERRALKRRRMAARSGLSGSSSGIRRTSRPGVKLRQRDSGGGSQVSDFGDRQCLPLKN